MDSIRMNCPMAVLSAETNMAGVSELSPAIFLSSATLTGLYPNEIENGLRQKNEKKYSACSVFINKTKNGFH